MSIGNFNKIYALVDCNAFFCSCEQLFRPDLKDRPVGVLSNNDGCFVSRTKELKELGIKMSQPYFKVKDICEKNKVAVFSANFPLYSNISHRVMNVLASFAPNIEVYSIDEAFLDITDFKDWDLHSYGKKIKNTIEKNIGIPVCVGIGPSKTLAKLANHIAKKSKKAAGVVVLLEKSHLDIGLSRVPVSDVWGIGKKTALKCQYLGIKSALDFRDYKNTKLLKKFFTIVGRRIQEELKGESCFELELERIKKKEIMSSRSFGQGVYDLKGLREAVAIYISLAGEKMRKQESVCKRLEVFCRSNPFNNKTQYQGHDFYKMLGSTSDTRVLIKNAWQVLDDIYKPGFEYKKAGIKLLNFNDSNEYQLSLMEEYDSTKSEKLMKVIDEINCRDGRNTIKSMACGVDNKTYKMRQNMKSPRHLQGWGELKKIN